MLLHTQVLEKEGKKEFVVLPYDEFLKIQGIIEDFEDIQELKKAKEAEKHLESTPLSKAVEDLKIGAINN
jgi:hypothetical protein